MLSFSVILSLLLLLYLSAALLLFLLQEKLLFKPSWELFRFPDSDGMDYQDIDLKTPDGLTLNAWYIPVEGSPYTVLMCHGNAGSLSHRIGTVKMLHDIGLSVFIFDYRGFGISEGKPSEKGMYIDAEAAYAYLVGDLGVSPDRIIIWGRSLGGPVAAKVASESSCSGTVLESTFTSYCDMAKIKFPYFPSKLLAKFKFSTIDYVACITSPVLIVLSMDDEVVPFWMGEELFMHCKEQKTFVSMTGSHNNTYFECQDIYIPTLERFFASL